jgi:nucleotide-binding universal stress UspA family protein
MIRAIAHPTDFSDAGAAAFEHALRLAMLNRSALDLLHVTVSGEDGKWGHFPHVREILHRWSYLEPDADVRDIAARTGVSVRKVNIRESDAAEGLSRYLDEHRPDLLVMASRGHAGLERWMKGSVSAAVVRDTLVPTLVLGPKARPFVSSTTGELGLETLLVPIDHEPSPKGLVEKLESVTEALGVTIDVVHVGNPAPIVEDANGERVAVRILEGPVVPTLLQAAEQADLVAMLTAGRAGFLDAFRGSTTERMIHGVTCPVLVLPLRS